MIRRRGVFLVELLTVLMLVMAGGTLAAVGLASLVRSHSRVARFDNRQAQISDLAATLSRDVRRAETAQLIDQRDDGVRQELWIGKEPRRVTYRFFDHHVERTGFHEDAEASTAWEGLSAMVGVERGPLDRGHVVVSVTVYWPRLDRDDVEPDRRLDFAVRCAGETSHEEH